MVYAVERKQCRVTPHAWYNRGTIILRKERIANRRKSHFLKSISWKSRYYNTDFCSRLSPFCPPKLHGEGLWLLKDSLVFRTIPYCGKKLKTFLKKLKVFKKKLLIFFENDLIFQSWFTYVCIGLHIRMCSSLRTYVKKRVFWHAGCLRKMLHNPSLLLQWNKNAGNCNKCFIEVAGCPLLLLQKNF